MQAPDAARQLPRQPPIIHTPLHRDPPPRHPPVPPVRIDQQILVRICGIGRRIGPAENGGVVPEHFFRGGEQHEARAEVLRVSRLEPLGLGAPRIGAGGEEVRGWRRYSSGSGAAVAGERSEWRAEVWVCEERVQGGKQDRVGIEEDDFGVGS